MPSTISLYLIGIWFAVGLFFGLGFALGSMIVARIFR
jgi:hypothetical protein